MVIGTYREGTGGEGENEIKSLWLHSKPIKNFDNYKMQLKKIQKGNIQIFLVIW